MASSIITEGRVKGSTRIDGVRASGMKGASHRLIRRVWNRSGDTVKRFSSLRATRERSQQTLRIGMLRLTENMTGIPLFRDDACIHHVNPVGDV